MQIDMVQKPEFPNHVNFLFQRRNRHLIDRSRLEIAVWNSFPQWNRQHRTICQAKGQTGPHAHTVIDSPVSSQSPRMDHPGTLFHTSAF